MVKKHSVKARSHYGAKSMDLTIPAAICKKYDISDGDVFIVDVRELEKDIEITYERMYKQKTY
jgi:hypothetical protein